MILKNIGPFIHWGFGSKPELEYLECTRPVDFYLFTDFELWKVYNFFKFLYLRYLCL